MVLQGTAACANVVLQCAPLVVLCLGAVISIVISAIAHTRPAVLKAAGTVAIVVLIAALGISWYLWLINGSGATSLISFDRTALATTGIICIAALFTSLLSIAYLPTGHHVHSEYYTLVLLSAAGMVILASATHLISLFIGLETASLALYALAGILRYQARSNESAIKYMIAGMVAFMLIALGSAFIYGAAGSANFADIGTALPNILASDLRWILVAGAALVLSGLCIKISVVPFHAWFIDVIDGAPTPVAAYASTAMLAAVMTVLMRLDVALFSHLGTTWIVVASSIALVTIAFGALAATIQENIKRLLAYSAVINAGFMFMAFPALSAAEQTARAALIAYLITYTLMTIGAFAVVIALNEGCEEHHSISSFAGLGRRRPVLAFALTLFLIALAGLPPSMGFIARYYIFTSTVAAGLWWLALVGALAGVIAAYAYLRVMVIMYMHRKSPSKALAAQPSGLEASTAVLAVIFLCALAVIFFGLIPTTLIDIVLHSV